MATDEALANLLAMCRATNEARKQAIAPPFEPECKCTPKTVSTEQMEQFEQAIKQQRIEREKGGWRDAAKWLEENFPEDYAAPRTAAASRPSCGGRSSDNRGATVEPQGPSIVSQSPRSAPQLFLPHHLWSHCQARSGGRCFSAILTAWSRVPMRHGRCDWSRTSLVFR
jgi:hypothetical protein